MKSRFLSLIVSLPLVALLLSLMMPAQAHADSIDEGIEYRVLPQQLRAEPGDDIEVLELFWYGCPHCWYLEPALEAWLKTKPEDVSFRRLPSTASSRWVPHAKAFFAADVMGELDSLHRPLFEALHEQRRRVLNDEQLIDFAAEQGIDEEQFRRAYQSFPVDMRVRKTTDLGRQYGIDGVPAIVVNGKYVTSASQAGSTERMFEVIDSLIEKERAAAQ